MRAEIKSVPVRIVFPVLHSDITLRFPGSVVYVSKHYGVTDMSRMFLLNLLSMVYETLNSRDARRRIAGVYEANVLGLCRRHHREMLAPYCLTWQLQAIPCSESLQRIVVNLLGNFAKARVEVMKNLQFVYNGQGLRGDGHFKLAGRVAVYQGKKCIRGRPFKVYKRPFTVAIAWCGVDGS